MLVIGADLPVDSASEIARGFGISPAVIGLTP
jgi:Ca2+/Na+ antiporter